MSNLLLVAAGGSIGAGLRYLVSLNMNRWVQGNFPWATLCVNGIGAFLMGALLAWLARRGELEGSMRLLLATGLLGGFTTFSAFSWEVVVMWQQGRALGAGAYIVLSVGVSIAALLAGHALVK